MKYSIVIPTYNHCDDALKPCVESLLKYTDMHNKELVIVANGCTDNTIEYLHDLKSRLESSLVVIWSKEPTQPEPVLILVPRVASRELTSSCKSLTWAARTVSVKSTFVVKDFTADGYDAVTGYPFKPIQAIFSFLPPVWLVNS